MLDIEPLHHRYRTENNQFRYNWLEISMYTDILLVREKYFLGNMCGQIFTTRFVHLRFFPLMKKGDT